jgi:hypothetical protein
MAGVGPQKSFVMPQVHSATSLSQCTKTCGEGSRYRQVVCVDEDQGEVHSAHCDDRQRPADHESCSLQPCEYVWITGEWSEVLSPGVCVHLLSSRPKNSRVTRREWVPKARITPVCSQTGPSPGQKPTRANGEICRMLSKFLPFCIFSFTLMSSWYDSTGIITGLQPQRMSSNT